MRLLRHTNVKETLLSSGVFLWCLCLGLPALGQSKNSRPIDGERLNYVVSYQWGPFYLEVGDVAFTTQSLEYPGNQLWSFEGWGTSRDHWNWFYEVNSVYASLADDALQPMNFQRKGREGSHRYDRWYFLGDSTELSWISLDDELESGTIERSPTAQAYDVMTAVHSCRHLPWESTAPGDTLPLLLLLDGEVHETFLAFEGNTEHTDPTTGASVPCWAFSPTLIDGTVFKAGDEMRVVVTADERRLPLYVETELVVGKAKIYLDSWERLSDANMRAFRAAANRDRDAALNRK